jgi:hypothetical protein
MSVSDLTSKPTTNMTGLTRSQGSFPEWCIDACGGDSLLAVDLAVSMYALIRRTDTAAAEQVG